MLLQPDLLVNLASSFVLEARRHGLGLLDEEKLLAGGYAFRELEDLEEDEREALLDAAAGLFLKRHIVFREIVQDDSVLVAPALINEKRPKDTASSTRTSQTFLDDMESGHFSKYLTKTAGDTQRRRSKKST